jgi:L-erythrulose 1-phosphate isomerase
MTGRFHKLFIGSNLKMYKNIRQTLEFTTALQSATRDISRADLELFILPSYLTLPDVLRAAERHLLKIGAQNMHWEEEGPFTGEISPLMLEEVEVDIVMVGHAERRQLFGETDWMVNQRVRASLAHGFQTLLCVGDTQDEKRDGATEERLEQQLKIALQGVQPASLEKIWIAYEPVWAIGDSGTVADPLFANQMHSSIHGLIGKLYPGCAVPVLYGGSVNQDNAAELVKQPDIDGLFIGRAAWDAKNFERIIRLSLGSVSNLLSV